MQHLSVRALSFRYHSWAANGLSISSKPSTGLMTVIVGPRKTTSPRPRVWGSGSAGYETIDVRGAGLETFPT